MAMMPQIVKLQDMSSERLYKGQIMRHYNGRDSVFGEGFHEFITEWVVNVGKGFVKNSSRH
jgi:hypothetical protein